MRRAGLAATALGALALGGLAPAGGAQEGGTEAATQSASYWVYVANESSDLVSRVRFDGRTAVEEKTVSVGYHPADIDGAHGLTVAPDGAHWYVSIAHGQPYGQVWKLETGTDRFVDSTTVGLFPATMAVSPDGMSLFVANFNLHGDRVPSSISAVMTPFMAEMGKVETCVMPHGSRISRDGARHYSTCMMSDQLVEISTATLSVTRRMSLTRGHEGPLAEGRASSMVMGGAACKPTWIALAPDDLSMYVPCNGRGEILEIDRARLAVVRRFATGAGPYNADVSADGRTLVVTLKSDQAIALVDIRSGRQTRVESTRPLPHGVVVSPDSRYAFVTNEAVGATRGTLDVIDLEAGARVATVELQHQPGGIGFWKMEPATR